MAIAINKDLFDNIFFKQIFLWILFYLISDAIMLSLVCGSYMFYKQALYRYARFKFIFTSVLLTLNFLWLGYGAYIIHNLPTNFASDSTSR